MLPSDRAGSMVDELPGPMRRLLDEVSRTYDELDQRASEARTVSDFEDPGAAPLVDEDDRTVLPDDAGTRRRRARWGDQASEGRYATMPLAVVEADGKDRIVDWNGAATELFGWSRQEVLRGMRLQDLLAAPSVGRLGAMRRHLPRVGSVSGVEMQARTRGGDHIECEWSVSEVRDERGKLLSTVATVQDISERAAAVRVLREKQERYSLAVHAARDGIWDYDVQLGTTWFSPRCYAMVDRPLVKPWRTLEEWLESVHEEDRAGAHEALMRFLDDGNPGFELELRMPRLSGELLWVQLRGSAIRDERGHALRLAGSMSDVTERKRHEEQLVRASHHDNLTGLPNRALLLDALRRRMTERLQGDPRGRAHDAVVFIDLDRFKEINDRLGHSVGDQLLRAFAQRLQARVRQGDIVARLGGDEFSVLMGQVRDSQEAQQAANRLGQELSAPFSLGAHTLQALGSIGVACTDRCPADPDAMLRAADIAMYTAKSQGTGRVAVFQAQMDDAVRARAELLQDLRRALDRSELRLVFQPIIEVRSSRPLGFEALLRWNRGGEDISPARFVPLAEEAGLMAELGPWVLERAVRAVGTWSKEVGPHLYVSVNMSPQELEPADLLSRLDRALTRNGVQARQVAIEVTETSMIHAPQLNPQLAHLRSRGHLIMMDDFGTGYASLQNLVELEFDTIKVDRSFIERCTQGQTAFLEAIVHLARRLGKPIVAEGVEQMDVMKRLAFLGVDAAQGFAIARPLEAADVLPWLRAGAPKLAAAR